MQAFNEKNSLLGWMSMCVIELTISHIDDIVFLTSTTKYKTYKEVQKENIVWMNH